NEEFLPQDLTGVHGLELFGHHPHPLLVVVDDLDFDRAIRGPAEAHSELVIDPDRVLAFAIAQQCLEAVTRWRSQIAEIARGVEVTQFPPRYLDQIGRKAFRALAIENSLGGFVPEAPDHGKYVSFSDTAVKSSLERPAALSRRLKQNV